MSTDLKNQSDLNKLFNSKVTKAEYMVRPLDSFGSSSSGTSSKGSGLPASSSGTSSRGSGLPAGSKSGFDYYPHHAGVAVTVENGDRWLIHKGENYGKQSSTVITDAKNMSSNWSQLDSKSLSGSGHTVNSFMQNGLVSKPYNLIRSNCQTAANGMWKHAEGYKP